MIAQILLVDIIRLLQRHALIGLPMFQKYVSGKL
jgi:hypothetical protein